MHSSTCVGQEGLTYDVGRSRPTLRRYFGRSGHNHDIARVTYPGKSNIQTPVYERITPKVEDESTSAERDGYVVFFDIFLILGIPRHDLETCTQVHASGKRT